MNHVRDFPLEEGHSFPPNKEALQLHIVKEENLDAVWITLKRSNYGEAEAVGQNMDPFIVSARYDSVKTQSQIVQTCITHNGQHLNVPPQKEGKKTKGQDIAPLPLIYAHDLPPPEQNKIVTDMSDNENIVGEEGDPDSLLKDDPDALQFEMLENDLFLRQSIHQWIPMSSYDCGGTIPQNFLTE